MTAKLLLSLVLLSGIATAAPKAKKPSSEIPAKREFTLSPSANACTDFHQYVCSEVENSFKLRDDRRMHTFAFNDSSERILEKQKDFMRLLPTQKDLDPRTMQIKDFYLACMNGPAKAKSEKGEVKRLLAEVSALQTTEELVAYSHKNMPNGNQLITGLWSTNNLDDSDKMDGILFSRVMFLPDHKYYEDKKLMAEYRNLVALFFQNVDPKMKKKTALEKADSIIALETEFIKTYPVAAVRRQRWGEKRVSPQKDLLAKYPHLQLQDVFAYVPETLMINTPIPEGLDFMEKNLPSVPLQTWKDLYIYASLDDLLDDAYPQYFKKKFNIEHRYFGGPAKRPDRQERCTRLAKDHFSKEMDAALIEKMFPNFDDTKINEVASRIRSSIVDGIKQNTWLSKDAKKEALNKIQGARLQLVKPQNDREWDWVPQRDYSPDDFVANSRTYNQASWEKTMKEVREPANKDAWGMGPLTVNAYYNPSENKFVLPMGILQFPFFNSDGDIIENLGAVGSVIGHELGHAVDDNGSKYDSKGRLRQWMTMKDLAEFSRRGEKMVGQFNDAGMDGKLTLGENVADLVGLGFAYHAAFPQNKGSIEDKQKFFVAYGRLWCSVVRPEFAELLKRSDPHASGVARINEQVKHQKAFAEAFSCKEGDKMNLPDSERIRIW